MDTFLARTSWLCRAGSSWQATASICRQQFCTMALGRRAKGGSGLPLLAAKPCGRPPRATDPAGTRWLEVLLSARGTIS